MENLNGKTQKQIVRMMATRMNRDSEAVHFLFKYDDYPFNEMRKYQTKITKCKRVIEECREWFQSAVDQFTKDEWNNLVVLTGDNLDCYSYETLHGDQYTW